MKAFSERLQKLHIFLFIEDVPHAPHGIELIQVDSRFFRQAARPLALARTGRFLHPSWAAVVCRGYEHAKGPAILARGRPQSLGQAREVGIEKEERGLGGIDMVVGA